MLAIINTSPLQYLHQLGLLHLLPSRYREILTPPAVVQEIEQGRRRAVDLPDLNTLSWLRVISAPAIADSMLLLTGIAHLGLGEQHLGLGEQQVIAHAVATSGLAILDDNEARRAANQLGVDVTGTLGLLLYAKNVGDIKLVEPHLDKLTRHGFFLSTKTRQLIMTMAGE